METKQLCNENKLEILGNIFNTSGTYLDHVNHRITKGRQAFYGLSPVGMTCPGASTEAQSIFLNVFVSQRLLMVAIA